jgi:hypothetical protein
MWSGKLGHNRCDCNWGSFLYFAPEDGRYYCLRILLASLALVSH